MAGASRAVTLATRLNDIGFAEFTTTLINDVFNALISSNLRQMDAYIDLVNAVASSLEDYINNTRDEVSLRDIGAFLVAVGNIPEESLDLLVGQADPPAQNPPELSAEAVGRLNSAVALPTSANVDNDLGTSAINLDENGINSIREAIANRIASNRFTLLQEMVRLGILRLVVDHGVIETRMTFSTYGRTTTASNEMFRERDRSESSRSEGAGMGVGGIGGIGGLLGSGLVGVGGGGGVGLGYGESERNVNVTVSTASSSERDVVGSRVQIYGRVEIHFKTDFVPLNP